MQTEVVRFADWSEFIVLRLCEHKTVRRRVTNRGVVLLYGGHECLDVTCLICGATARAEGGTC